MNITKAKSGVVPAKTIERLVLYRILLEEQKAQNRVHIVSSEMAEIAGNTPAQVRRDLMVVGYSGSSRNGYQIEDLLKAIRSLLEPEGGITLAIVGVGNLGRALLGYFSLLQPRFRIAGAFDNDINKVNRTISGFRIHHISEMGVELAKNPAQLGVITVPPDQAQKAVDFCVIAGIKGIVNFAAIPLRVPGTVWIENMHITSTMEKVAYFSRMKQQGE